MLLSVRRIAAALALIAVAIAPCWAQQPQSVPYINNSLTLVPRVLHQSGVPVTNTGIGTSEINLVSTPYPPLGPNDSLRITSLWNVGGTATNTKTLLIKIGQTSCVPLSPCNINTAFFSGTMNSASLITASTLTMMRNASATNSQVGFSIANTTGLGAIAGALTTGTVQTSAGGFINFDCTTNTSSADSCTLEGYTVELIPGVP